LVEELLRAQAVSVSAAVMIRAMVPVFIIEA